MSPPVGPVVHRHCQALGALRPLDRSYMTAARSTPEDQPHGEGAGAVNDGVRNEAQDIARAVLGEFMDMTPEIQDAGVVRRVETARGVSGSKTQWVTWNKVLPI